MLTVPCAARKALLGDSSHDSTRHNFPAAVADATILITMINILCDQRLQVFQGNDVTAALPGGRQSVGISERLRLVEIFRG